MEIVYPKLWALKTQSSKPEELMFQPQGKGQKLGDLEELIEHMKAEGDLLEGSLCSERACFLYSQSKEEPVT